MPIEFSCPQCLHPQKVDESKAGQQVYCRVCYFKLTVPAESTNKPIDESQLYTLNEKSWDMQDRQELISFSCETCHTNIGVRKDQVGEEIICEECGKKIIVPKSIADIAKAKLQKKLDKALARMIPKETYALRDGTTVPTNDAPKQFRFSCRLCGTALFATEEQIGTLVSCPDCETKTQVPAQTIKSEPSPLPPLTFEGTSIYEVATPSKSVMPQKNLVPVVCRFCGTRMHAEESQIGEFQTCPDCGQQTEIKAAPKPRKKTTDTTSADAYGLDKNGETVPRPTVSFFTSPLFATQRKRLNDQESFRSLNRPPLPKRPLTERFFVPFGSPDPWLSLALFVPVVPLGALVLSWAAGATEGGGKMGEDYFGFAIFAICIGLLTFTLFMGAFGYFASFLIHLYSFTNSGMDKEEFRGEVALADYFVMGFWLFAFSVIAALPGFFVGKFSGAEAWWFAIMILISHWFFFPICFLSSMETGSMFGVLAKGTVASLFRQPFAWFRFYLLTGMLFFLSDLCLFLIGALWSSSAGLMYPVTLTLFFFLFAIQLLFFFRLLGRHAWLLEETDRRKWELEEERIIL